VKRVRGGGGKVLGMIEDVVLDFEHLHGGEVNFRGKGVGGGGEKGKSVCIFPIANNPF